MVEKLTCVRDLLRFEWSGGEYIDVFKVGDEYAFAAINVWDHNKGAPSIPFTYEALCVEAEEWLRT